MIVLCQPDHSPNAHAWLLLYLRWWNGIIQVQINGTPHCSGFCMLGTVPSSTLPPVLQNQLGSVTEFPCEIQEKYRIFWILYLLQDENTGFFWRNTGNTGILEKIQATKYRIVLTHFLYFVQEFPVKHTGIPVPNTGIHVKKYRNSCKKYRSYLMPFSCI